MHLPRIIDLCDAIIHHRPQTAVSRHAWWP